MKKNLIVFLLFASFIVFGLNIKAKEKNCTINELNQGVYFNSDLIISEEEYEYKINNIKYEQNCYVVVGSVVDNNITDEHLEDYITYPYVAYYNEYGKVFGTIDKTLGHGEYKDAIIVENEIIVIGSFETSTDCTQLVVSRFNKNGNVNGRYKTSGNYSTFGERICFQDNNYYLVGITNATNLGGECLDVHNKICVLKLNADFNFVKIIYINNSMLSTFYDAVFGYGYIYLYCTLKGEGDFNVNKIEGSKIVVSIDENLNVDGYTRIYNSNIKLVGYDNGVILISYGDDLKSVNITKYSRDMKEIKQTMPFTLTDTIESVAMNSSLYYEDIVLVITVHNQKGFYNLIYRMNDEARILDETSYELNNNNMNVSKIFYDNGYYLLFGYDQYRYGKKIMYVFTNESNNCYFNGNLGNTELGELDTSVYGKYNQDVIYSYSDIIINTVREVTVPLKLSVKDKGVYDRKVTLEFNGTGYLNGEAIPNGYMVDKVGNYILEIKGKNITTYITFEVANLCIKENNINNELVNINVEDTKKISTIDGNSESKLVNESYTLISENTLQNMNNKYYYILIFVAVGITCGLLIPLERIGKKDE